MNINQKNKAMTLVELVVIITILSILGVIAFLSFQGYTKDARDSVRLSDLSKIMTNLEIFKLSSGFYPEPTLGISVKYKGADVRTQGVVGDSVITNLKKINTKPLDPLTGDEYTYSRLNTKKEYELGAIMEGDFAYNPGLVSQANAMSGFKALIKGNYNGAVAKVNTGSTTYVLAVPSIISSELNPANLIDILEKKGLVFNGKTNIPSSYVLGDYNHTLTGGFNYSNIDNLVIYEGNILDLSKSGSLLKNFTKNLQLAYSGSEIIGEGIYASIMGLDLTSESEISSVVGILINEYLGGNVEILTTDSLGNALPIILSTYPTSTIITNTTEIGVVTNKNMTCKYDLVNVDYDIMENTFSITGGVEHVDSYEPLEGENTLFIMCRDNMGNNTPLGFISFTYTTGTPVNINFTLSGSETYICTMCD